MDKRKTMKIAIAFDSFKGSLSSVEAAHAFIDGFRSEIPDTDFVSFAIADGGEGMLSSLLTPQSVTIEKDVTNPIGKIVLSKYLIEGHKAIIEMAQASGLTLVPEHLRNPMLTTSFGTGELIMDASKPDGTMRKLTDISRIKALGWEPKITLEAGVEETYQWFRDKYESGDFVVR